MLAVVISVVGLWLSFLENIFRIFLNEVSLFNGNYYHYLLKIYLRDECKNLALVKTKTHSFFLTSNLKAMGRKVLNDRWWKLYDWMAFHDSQIPHQSLSYCGIKAFPWYFSNYIMWYINTIITWITPFQYGQLRGQTDLHLGLLNNQMSLKHMATWALLNTSWTKKNKGLNWSSKPRKDLEFVFIQDPYSHSVVNWHLSNRSPFS